MDGGKQIFTKVHFEQHLRTLWAERGWDLANGERVGVPVADLVAHSSKRNTELDLPFVDLWVAILDECISWFISLSSVVSVRRERAPFSAFEKAVWLLVSKIIADSTAIRHLVLAGFDTSARTILRSLSEYMEVLVAVIHRPEFAHEFNKSDTPEAAQAFWEAHLRGGKLRRRVTAAWLDFLTKDDAREAAEWFANWGRISNPMLSGLAHPSIGGGLFSAVPLKAQYPEEGWLGIWGDKGSARSIQSTSTRSSFSPCSF